MNTDMKEIDISRNNDSVDLKTVAIGGSSTETTNTTDVTKKINLQRTESPKQPELSSLNLKPVPDKDRIVPVEDLDLLVDQTKTKSDSVPSPKVPLSNNEEPTKTSTLDFLQETTDLSDILDKKQPMILNLSLLFQYQPMLV